jgi:hypothetical protein
MMYFISNFSFVQDSKLVGDVEAIVMILEKWNGAA